MTTVGSVVTSPLRLTTRNEFRFGTSMNPTSYPSGSTSLRLTYIYQSIMLQPFHKMGLTRVRVTCEGKAEFAATY